MCVSFASHDALPRPRLALPLAVLPTGCWLESRPPLSGGFQVFLSVLTVFFSFCDARGWPCFPYGFSPGPGSERGSQRLPSHLQPGGAAPVLCSQRHLTRATAPGRSCPLPAHRLPDIFTTACSCELSHVSCISTRAQTACPPKPGLSSPGTRALCGLPVLVALGSRFLSIHVLPALSGWKAPVVSNAALILSQGCGGGH